MKHQVIIWVSLFIMLYGFPVRITVMCSSSFHATVFYTHYIETGTSINIHHFICNINSCIASLISYWKHQWFHIEPGYRNPYKTVYSILKYSKSHKHPLQRSAFTYSENYIPSRLDFAKERFGGPFTTEQVENVKSFFRMLVIMFAIGPVFVLEVPTSYFIFPLFSLHFHSLHH